LLPLIVAKKPKEILPWALCLLVILKNNLLD